MYTSDVYRCTQRCQDDPQSGVKKKHKIQMAAVLSALSYLSVFAGRGEQTKTSSAVTGFLQPSLVMQHVRLIVGYLLVS